MRYLKQIKCRNGAYEYDADNVIVCEVKKNDAFLQFVTLEHATEAEHLKTQTPESIKERNDAAIVKSKEGKSQRQIAHELGLSVSTINRILNKAKEVQS